MDRNVAIVIQMFFAIIVIMVIVLIVLFLEPGLNFFLFGLAYVLSGPLASYWRWRTGGALVEVHGDSSSEASVEERPQSVD